MRICRIRQIPRREPKFHHDEMFDGAGRSMNALFTIVLNFGGSFLGLMVFLIYLGGMMVVFGYTTAMATEQYPEIWLSNKAVLGAFVTGLLMEFFMVYYVLKDKEVEVVFEFNGLGIG